MQWAKIRTINDSITCCSSRGWGQNMRVWRRGSINRNYVSGLDRFLFEFDKRPEAHSSSRRAEEVLHAYIGRLRDNAKAEERPKT